MPYPSPLGGVTRRLTENIVIHSAPFTRGPILNFGARMALIQLPLLIVVWLAIPWGPEAKAAFAELTGSTDQLAWKVSHIIVPDREHTMAAGEFKTEFPDAVVVGPAGANHVEVGVSEGNKVLESLPGTTGEFADAFSAVFVPGHTNQELVVVHKPTRTLFEADLLFNIQPKLEQYGGKNPNTGLSFLTRYLQPYSKVGGWLTSKILPPTAENKAGIAAIASLDFDRLVMCHGEVVDSGAKQVFTTAFAGYLHA